MIPAELGPVVVAEVLGVIFLSTLVRSTFGFGDGLVAMPLLTIVVGLKTGSPLVALCGLTSAIVILLGCWRDVVWKEAWPLVIAASLGVPVGIIALKYVNEVVMTNFLGAFIIIFGVYSLSRAELPELKNGRFGWIFGVIAGCLGGAYNTSGPPLVLYGNLCRWNPERFRATMMSFFLPMNLIVVVSHGLSGFWSEAVLRCYVLALPGLFLAIFLGAFLNKRLPTERFNHLIYVLIILLGLLLVLKNLLGF